MPPDIRSLVYPFALVLFACGGAVDTSSDAATNEDAQTDAAAVFDGAVSPDVANEGASALPKPLRCAMQAGDACDSSTFPPTCCDDSSDGGLTLHACVDTRVMITSSTCAP